MSNIPGSDRLVQLAAAFTRLLPGAPGLSLGSAGSEGVQPYDRVCTVHLVQPDSPEVTLTVHPGRAEVTVVAGRDAPVVDAVLLQDTLGVHLADGFKWNDAYCGTADELAYLLLKHMRRRARDASNHG